LAIGPFLLFSTVALFVSLSALLFSNHLLIDCFLALFFGLSSLFFRSLSLLIGFGQCLSRLVGVAVCALGLCPGQIPLLNGNPG
jgi:hypothetical protein